MGKLLYSLPPCISNMRVKIHLLGSGILPFDYHYHLSSAMYRYKRIANEDLATRLHYSREIKTFTFSEIIVPNRKVHPKGSPNEGIEIKDNRAYLIYSSPSKDFVEAVVEGLLAEPELRVGKLKFTVDGVEILKNPDVEWHTVHFRTLSPIVMSTRNAEGKKVPLLPDSKEWYVNLEKNIKHGYEVFYGEEPRGKVEIEALRVKMKKYEFPKEKGGKIQAVHGHFIFRGSPELIRFAYEAGVGERGAMGFGCLEVVKDKNDSKIVRGNI